MTGKSWIFFCHIPPLAAGINQCVIGVSGDVCFCNLKGFRSGGGGGGVTLIRGTSCIKPIKALPGLRGALTDGAANQLAQRHVLPRPIWTGPLPCHSRGGGGRSVQRAAIMSTRLEKGRRAGQS